MLLNQFARINRHCISEMANNYSNDSTEPHRTAPPNVHEHEEKNVVEAQHKKKGLENFGVR